MSYTTARSGFTGPSAKIGGSTDYHIDLKLLDSLPVAEKAKMVDALARQYQSIGRDIEFSNPAVSGQRWNLTADLSNKIDLLNRAAAAHSHSQHQGWNSLDFYVPFKGKSRFDKGAVEDASIYLPAVPGGKVRRGSGGGYGYYSEALDPTGRIVARVGHGNIDRPEAEGDLTLPLDVPSAPELPSPAKTEEETKQDFLANYIKDNLQNQIFSQLFKPSSSSMDFIKQMSAFAPQSPLLNPLQQAQGQAQ